MEEEKRNISFFGVISILVLLGFVGYLLYQNQTLRSGKSNSQPTPATMTPFPTTMTTNTPLPTSTPMLPTPTTQPSPTAGVTIPAGWQTYENSEYGFAISYPSNYQALDDAENLYGWPKAVVLIYGGGQSYDLPIEVWDTVAEYETKYSTQMNDLTVKQIGSKYITLLNANKEPVVDQIITTFRTTN